MNIISNLVLLALLTAGTMTTTGCYTVLVHHHRDTDRHQENEETAEPVTCDLCGGDHSSLYHYGGMMIDPDFGVYSRWYDYYENPQPWWVYEEAAAETGSGTEDHEGNYSGRNYGRRRQALEDKNGGTGNGGAVESGSGGYSGTSAGGIRSTGTGAVISTPAVQADSTGGQTGGSSAGSAINQQNNENKNTQRDYGGRTTRKKK